jgi:hypothetical protein
LAETLTDCELLDWVIKELINHHEQKKASHQTVSPNGMDFRGPINKQVDLHKIGRFGLAIISF